MDTYYPYKFNSAHDWMKNKIRQWQKEDQADLLAEALTALVDDLDSDHIEETFGPEMGEDGYFEPEPPPGDVYRCEYHPNFELRLYEKDAPISLVGYRLYDADDVVLQGVLARSGDLFDANDDQVVIQALLECLTTNQRLTSPQERWIAQYGAMVRRWACDFLTDPFPANLTPEEYAALWGGDPAYDHDPNLPGDGYKFYNFNAEGYDPTFLKTFIPAIERTIAAVESKPDCYEPPDADDLRKLLAFVQARLAILEPNSEG